MISLSKNEKYAFQDSLSTSRRGFVNELYNISQKKLSEIDKSVEARRGEGTTDYNYLRTSKYSTS